ncbi:neurotrimin [Hyalella azteca]|uniref:Neurotrimin n=1 Tax=Hyalella azteca TaxID=294128 RepID=A0A8B7NZS3_HYAAZ|nr:neurotrimin [Hyalella azteca]
MEGWQDGRTVGRCVANIANSCRVLWRWIKFYSPREEGMKGIRDGEREGIRDGEREGIRDGEREGIRDEESGDQGWGLGLGKGHNGLGQQEEKRWAWVRARNWDRAWVRDGNGSETGTGQRRERVRDENGSETGTASSGTGEPVFVEAIDNVTVTAGRDVRLACTVDNLGTYKVAWIAFDKSAILTVEEHVITRNPRVNVSYDGHRTWTLHLSKVNASDAGTYMCQVNTIVAKSQFGIISVVVPPHIVDSDSSGDVMVQEGANVTMSCAATGHPPPDILWRREDGKRISVNRTHSVAEFSGSELRLSRVSRTDMAAYLCIARNGVPPIVSKRIKVSVDFPPMMNIPHQLVGAPLGFSFTLECTIEAHPQALTYWTRGPGAMIHHSDKFFISETPGTEPYRTHMKLTVKDLQEEDFGSYKCVAKNSRGETEGEMKLYSESCRVKAAYLHFI